MLSLLPRMSFLLNFPQKTVFSTALTFESSSTRNKLNTNRTHRLGYVYLCDERTQTRNEYMNTRYTPENYYLLITDIQGLLQFGSFLLNFGVEISTHGLLRPVLIVKFCSSFFLRISNHIGHRL